jgi:RimJ/RimL family protein N-acetyltransferase
VLTSERLRLRPFEAADAADVHAVWQDERFVRTAPVGYAYANAGLETAVEWCTTGMEERRRAGEGVGFAVVPREGGRLVGHVALFGVDWTAELAEIHYWTAPWARGNGYAAEAAGAVARWALLDAGIARVSLHAAVDNAASRHVAEAAGFRFEGVLRSAAPTRGGNRVDAALYSMIREDLSA